MYICTLHSYSGEYQILMNDYWERERWARLGNDYRALIDLENWCKNSFNKVVATYVSTTRLWSGYVEKEIMTWSHLFHWQLPVVPVICFFLELSGRKKPSLVYYDYIIKLIPINIPIFPLIPSSRYSFCGFPVSTLDSGILTDSTSLVPARTCSIMAF